MNCYMLIIWALTTLVDASTDDGNETIINVTTTTINDTSQASQILLPDGLLTSFGPMLDMYASPAIREFIVSWHRIIAGWLGFDPTILLSVGPIIWACKRIWSELVHLKDWVWEDIVCNYFTARVEVGDDDPIFIHTMRWVAVQPDSSKTRFLQADTIAGSADDHDEDDEAGAAAAAGAAAFKTASSTTTSTTDSSSNKKKKKQAPTILPNGEPCLNFSTHKHQKPPRFLPAVNIRYKFWWSGGYFWLNRTRSQVTHSSEWRGLSLRREENLVITCVGFSPNPIKNFIQFTKEWNHSRQAATTIVRRPARPEIRSWGGRHVWAEVADRPIRPMDTVVLDEKQKLMVLQDMNEYLHRDTAQWYGERGIPLRRGYLFHGPPGTGKTSLSFALAGVFGLDIFVISLLDQNLTEDDLAMLFTNLPRRCVVLLEDIDTAGLVNRDKEESESSESSDSSSEEDSEEGDDYLESEEKRALEVLLLKGRLARTKKKNKGKGKELSPEDAALEKELAEKVAEYRETLKQEGSDEEKANGEKKEMVGDKVSDGEEDTGLTTPETEAEKKEKPVESEDKPTSSSSADDAEKKDVDKSNTTAEKKTTKRTKKPLIDKEKKALKKKKRMKKSKMLAASTIQSIEFIGRGYRRRNTRQQRSPYDRDRGISLSGLLNAIDGVASHEGRVLIMTTNKPEKLDEALLRPGRVDLQIAFLNATQEQVRELFERMYEADVVDPAQITFTKIGGKLTASTTTAATTPIPGSGGTISEKDQEKPAVIDPKIVDLKLLDDNNRKSSVSSCSSDATVVDDENANTPSSSPPAATTPNTAAEKQPSEEKKTPEPFPLSVTPLTRSELQKIAKEFSLKIPKTQVLSPAEIQGFLLRRKKDPRRALAEVDKWVEELVKAKETKSKILDAKAI